MRYWLPTYVHAVRIDDDVVFLETTSPTYLCLADGAAVISLSADGAVDVSVAEAAEPLREAGLLTTTPAEPRSQPPAQPTSSLSTPPFGLSPVALIRAVRANAVAAEAFEALTFQQMLDMARSTHEAATAIVADGRLMREAARFARMSPWLPKTGECLVRSLQQLLYLRRLGARPQWVFGVRTWPFDAHCWLQLGDTVLDDQVEHVQAFTPIMAI